MCIRDRTWFNVYVQITDGKSTAVKKQFYFQVEDTLGDGSLTVSGTAMVGSYSLASATVWQDLDNDGIQDGGEPTATTEIDGRFNLSVSKSDTDAPILTTGGYNASTGVANSAIYKISRTFRESPQYLGRPFYLVCLVTSKIRSSPNRGNFTS